MERPGSLIRFRVGPACSASSPTISCGCSRTLLFHDAEGDCGLNARALVYTFSLEQALLLYRRCFNTNHCADPCIDREPRVLGNNRFSEDAELDDAVHTALLTMREGFEGEMTEKNVEVRLDLMAIDRCGVEC